jgi:large subunit ribosomal protein L18
MYAQVVDDAKGRTIASVQYKEAMSVSAKNDVKRAFALGKILAEKCAKQKIVDVVFDRGGYKYHGKVKALADGARQGGLRF